MANTKQDLSPIKEVVKYGQSIWYDGLVNRDEFHRMVEEDGIRGATTNPTIFEKALSSGQYDAAIQKLSMSKNADSIYKALAIKAVQDVADQFLPVFNDAKGQDGFVSIEVSPLLAYDTKGTIEEAKELWKYVNHKNAMIKVPATKEGVPAVEALIAEGINVNVTLIFSLSRYREVMNAFIAGLEKRAAARQPVAEIASVASFFVSRVDSAVDALLDERIKKCSDAAEKSALQSLTGKIAIANSKAAYAEFEKVFTGARFAKLQAKGAQVQRPLWASTGTKNPAYSDVLYVETLIGAHTVNTIPPATLEAFKNHGKAAASTIKNGVEQAFSDLEKLEKLGISLNQITEELEKAGVRLFSDSYQKIIEGIKAKIK